MRSKVGASKMGHTIKAGEGSAATLSVMGVELFLREDISTVLGRHERQCQRTLGSEGTTNHTSHEKETMSKACGRLSGGSGAIDHRRFYTPSVRLMSRGLSDMVTVRYDSRGVDAIYGSRTAPCLREYGRLNAD